MNASLYAIITVLLLAIPSFFVLLLSYVTGGNLTGWLISSVKIAAGISLIVTTVIYAIARVIKYARIRKWFFVGCYLVFGLPFGGTTVVGVIWGLFEAFILGRTYMFNVEFFMFAFFMPLLTSVFVFPALFAHIAYILYARTRKKSVTD